MKLDTQYINNGSFIKAYKIKEALKSGFTKPRLALYLIRDPELVSNASLPPTEKPSLSSAPVASTIGVGVKPIAPLIPQKSCLYSSSSCTNQLQNYCGIRHECFSPSKINSGIIAVNRRLVLKLPCQTCGPEYYR